MNPEFLAIIQKARQEFKVGKKLSLFRNETRNFVVKSDRSLLYLTDAFCSGLSNYINKCSFNTAKAATLDSRSYCPRRINC